MGSDSDMPTMKGCFETLKKFNVPFEGRVISAHRTPDAASKFASEAAGRGFGVIIAAAGKAAHLAGFLAATYCRGIPVINYSTTFLAAADASIGGKTARCLTAGACF